MTHLPGKILLKLIVKGGAVGSKASGSQRSSSLLDNLSVYLFLPLLTWLPLLLHPDTGFLFIARNMGTCSSSLEKIGKGTGEQYASRGGGKAHRVNRRVTTVHCLLQRNNPLLREHGLQTVLHQTLFETLGMQVCSMMPSFSVPSLMSQGYHPRDMVTTPRMCLWSYSL